MEFCSLTGVQGSIGYGMSCLSEYFIFLLSNGPVWINQSYTDGLTNHLDSVDVYNQGGLNGCPTEGRRSDNEAAKTARYNEFLQMCLI